MELMQLKAPPDRVALIADAIEHTIDCSDDYLEVQKLTEILTWLRHRLAKWNLTHPDQPAA